MSDGLTDYDLENSIRCIAAKLDISGCSTETVNEVFEKIENACPEAAKILLERTFEKDKLRDYIARNPSIKVEDGLINGEGDPVFENHWSNLVKLYPVLLEAIDACKK